MTWWWWTELPHTATGKLQKAALRGRFANYLIENGTA